MMNQFVQVVIIMENVMDLENAFVNMDGLEELVKFHFVTKNGPLVHQQLVVVLLLILVNVLKVGVELIVHNLFVQKLVIWDSETNVLFLDIVNAEKVQKDLDARD